MGEEAPARTLGLKAGRRRAGGAAVLASLLLVAACTGSPPRGSAATTAAPPTATSPPPPIDADGRTSPSVVWSSGPRARPRPRGAGAVLVQVRTGRHDGFDRVVFEFRGGLPGYQARYVEKVTSASGARVSLRGEAFLLLAFDGARASEPGGGATFTLADPRPGYDSVKQVRLVDDGGGRVRFGVGLAAVAGYKVSELPPDRIYVDVAA
jgi:hypothetical protein